jgi:ADP-ribose pyrophosphatase YjhB (NUDIX family)
MPGAAEDYEEIPIRTGGQDWLIAWYPPGAAPSGKPHGSAGICVSQSDQVILVSPDGLTWDFPAGRTEDGETWEQTLRREVLEEACATVNHARLLGFCRSRCIRGHERGLVLVRSFWHACVEVNDWKPQYEVAHRKLVPPHDLLSHLPAAFEAISRRTLQEAGLL